MKVFVYGTLRKKGSNSERMQNAKFTSNASIQGELYQIDWYPGLILKGEDSVRGEIYEVTETLMSNLDEYEGREYDRFKQLVTDDNGVHHEVFVWIYNQPVDPKKKIPSGDWVEFVRNL